MRIKSHQWWLLAIFLLVFASRAAVTMQTELFSDDSSYFTLRQIESIKDTGKPIINDDLSYGGRTFLFSPLFYYILAAAYLFGQKIIVLKLFINLLASTVVFASFLIADELTKSKKIALLTSFLSGFIPIYFEQTVNSLSIYSFTLPVTFFAIYYLIKLNKDKKSYIMLTFLLFLLIIASPTSIIMILGILFFLLLARLERLELGKANVEILIVSAFFYLWLNFLIFKKAILFHGPQIIWQNIPKTYLNQYFSELTILQEVYLIGILPFVLGIYSAYIFVTRQKSLQVYIIIGAATSLFILLWFKLIPFKTGLVFLGGFLVLLLSEYFKLFFDYIAQTKFSRFSTLALVGFIILIIASSVAPSVYLGIKTLDEAPSTSDLAAYNWLLTKVKKGETVLAPQSEGHALAYFASVKTVIDSNFLLIKQIDQRISDIDRIYTTRFADEALELASKYGINYIIVDSSVKKQYGIEDIFYSHDECFFPIYKNGDVKIYMIICGES